ncbi:MAG TPA: NAD(P)-dependent oxidoreductase [Methylomirabilota bacterium]|jgi:3-hydroxyisobutyrate dehydrogenase-like beta-hydroxyacid dehydrogenase|nr:NAD(P)-dependent oxidoreductase [Methylomirabilota bacterium]
MHIGFVGTGNMGRPMAENILKKGHSLTVFDLQPEATAPLEALGATRAPDLPTLARVVRVTLLSLPDQLAVEAALFGRDRIPGLMASAQPGDVIFDLSTVGPETTRGLAARCRKHGVTLIDAPVSGSVAGARAGTLAVMIGASAEVAAPFESVFRAIGGNLFYLGEVGKGNILKLLNNYVALSNQAVLCEAMALADRLGIPRETVGEVIGKSSGASFILERKLAALVARDYRAGFFVDLAWKDLGLGLELAERSGAEAAVGREAWKLYGRAREAGLGRLDSSGLLGLLEPRKD